MGDWVVESELLQDRSTTPEEGLGFSHPIPKRPRLQGSRRPSSYPGGSGDEGMEGDEGLEGGGWAAGWEKLESRDLNAVQALRALGAMGGGSGIFGEEDEDDEIEGGGMGGRRGGSGGGSGSRKGGGGGSGGRSRGPAPLPSSLLLHFMICHSNKCHRPRTSSCHKEQRGGTEYG